MLAGFLEAARACRRCAVSGRRIFRAPGTSHAGPRAPMRARPVATLLIAAFLILSSVRPLHAAWPHDLVTHLHVAPSAFAQSQPRIAADGSGGFFITWQELSGGTGVDVYAQHLTVSGAIAPG